MEQGHAPHLLERVEEVTIHVPDGRDVARLIRDVVRCVR